VTPARRFLEVPLHYDIDRAALLAPALDELFAARVRTGRTPSVSYALVAGGRIVASGGFADEAAAPRPTLDTAFRVASCTKSFTTAALLQQRDAGRIDLDAPLTEYLPARTVPDGPAPTIAQLAAMSAGFPTDDPWGDRQESLDPARLDELAAAGFRLIARPGERFEYSNLGFALLGRALERVSGRRYVDLVLEDLAAPLGLEGLGFDPSVRADRVATGYARVDEGWEAQPVSSPGAFSPIGGLFATARSLAGWVAWLAAAGAPSADDAVLAAPSRRELWRARTPMPDSPASYGLGLVVEEDRRHGTVVGHSGGYPGFGAHLRWHAASGIGIVVLENARYSGAFVPGSAGLTTVLDAVAVPDREPDVWPETAAARLAVEQLLGRWDDEVAGALFAENVPLDEPLDRRRAAIGRLAESAGIRPGAAPIALRDAAPYSRSAAHLAWTVPGTTGCLRCEIRLTPELEPKVQTLQVRLG
jgi:CubicO group peptidase (beta-lactamase class C family)